MARRFDLTYAVTSTSIFSGYPREVYLELSNNEFGYLKKYPNQGHGINPQSLTINKEYKKLELKINFGTKYLYFQEEIDDIFPKSLFDELELNVL